MADGKKNTENKVFRQKSMDKVTSPEDLNSIIKVANPGVWILISAIIVLLIGALCWGFLGKIDTSVSVAVKVESSNTTVYVREADIGKIKQDQEVKFGEYTCKVGTIPERPTNVKGLGIDEYVLHVLGLNENDWVFVITTTSSVPDGSYSGKIITESISPISLIFN